MKIFAHRGYSARFPENTMLAFQMAAEAGCDGIELDVHFSRDHQLVIIHDESLSRTIDAVGFVRHHSYHDLKNYTAKGNYEGDRQHVPSLEEYLTWVEKYPIRTNIELKNDKFRYPGMEDAVVEAVRKHELEDRVIFSSFRAESVRQIKEQWPKLWVAWLVETLDEEIIRQAQEMGFDAIHPAVGAITPELVEKCHQGGLFVRPYTVNSDADLERMQEAGVDAIITDNPERSRDFLGLDMPSFYEEIVRETKEEEAETLVKTARDRLKLTRTTHRLSGGFLGIIFFMVISVAASVLAAKLVMSLLGRFF